MECAALRLVAGRSAPQHEVCAAPCPGPHHHHHTHPHSHPPCVSPFFPPPRNFLLYTTTPRIAAAVSQKDTEGVSRITSQTLWVASAIGLTMTALLWTQCTAIFTAMGAKPGVSALCYASHGMGRGICTHRTPYGRATGRPLPERGAHMAYCSTPSPEQATLLTHHARTPVCFAWCAPFCCQVLSRLGGPPPPQVLAYAVPYLRWRCIASPAILGFYVLSGTFRGYKDTM